MVGSSVWSILMSHLRDVAVEPLPRKIPSRVVLAQVVCCACGVWWMVFLILGGTHWGRALFAGRHRDDAASTALAMNGVALPLLLAITMAAWALHTSKAIPAANDPNFRRLGVFCIVLPSLVYVVSASYRHYQNTASEDWPLQLAALHVGNALGMVALLALSVLLVPVTRQGPVLRLLGWNPAAAVQLHIWMGRVVLLGVVGHGALHMLRWSVGQGEALSTVLVPPVSCFVGGNNNKNEAPLSHCQNEATQCQCRHLLRNLSGCIGAFALFALFGASLLRRRWYRAFYHVHMIAGPTILIATILHWKRSMLYLAASALYYTACTVVIYLRPTAPTQVQCVERIGTSCVALTVAASPRAMQSYRPGQYVQVIVPALSKTISHPFTISRTRNENELRLLLRTVGPWTQALVEQLGTTSPSLDIQGFYGGDRWAQLQAYDRIVMVAGGIGITPFLSVLLRQPPPHTRMELHWICRDLALIDYVRREYLDAAAVTASIRIVVYPTTTDDNIHTSSSTVAYENSPAAQPMVRSSTVCFYVLTISLWIGMAGVRLLFEVWTRLRPDFFWARLLMLVWVWIVCVGVALALLVQGDETARTASAEEHDDDQGNHNRHGPSETTELLEQGGVAYTTGGSVTIGAVGRPDPSVCVASLITADRPALWVCGPKGLVHAMRQEAAHHCIPVFQESFVL